MNSLKPYNAAVKLSSVNHDQRLTSTRIRIRIPKRYQQEPIISKLISQHGLTVNIAAALLGANAREDGWFDLELQGTVPQIQSALLYLNDLDLEIWYDSEQDDW
jgi:ABC-type methionine transport system ATPase subunit